MTNKYAIIIPIYKNIPSSCDILSLKQIFKVCNNDNIFFICGNSFDENIYINIVNELQFEGNVYCKKFEDKYFKSLESYSKLCLSYELYDSFSEYEYVFLYQLDGWIFKNDIEYWCNKGYDYIGGPILSQQANWFGNIKSSNYLVGNGGVSLRKIETMKQIFDRNGEIFNELPKPLQQYFDINSESSYPEDVIICDVISKYYFLYIPSWKVASEFSWDRGIVLLYKINKNIPMCAHNIYKQLSFWQNFIPEMNDKTIIEEAKQDYQNMNSESYIEYNKKMQNDRMVIAKFLEAKGLL